MAVDLDLEWGPSPGMEAPEGRVPAADALVASLRTFGRVDMRHIAALMGVTEEKASLELGDAVFLDPATMEWQSADEYLSGNLHHKLDVALEALESTGRFGRNVTALEDALPPKVPHQAIYVSLGSPWLPEDVVLSFIAHLMGVPVPQCKVLHDPATGSWDISHKGRYKLRPESVHIWGTMRMPALSIVESILNGRPVRVTDEEYSPDTRSGKRRVLNREETLMAADKERAIQEEFSRWVWEEPTRRARLTDIYNARYGGYRRRHYDGRILEFPGMADGVALRPHQRDAAMRILLERDVLVAHDVGAGKTYTAIAAIMELRRMGISRKNLVVVPNNVMHQWARMFRAIYPAADLLAVYPKDFVPSKRQAMLCRMRDEDHDAILMAYSSFSLVPISKEEMLRSLDLRIRELGEIMGNPRRSTSAVKREHASLKRRRERLAEEGRRTDGVTFDLLGVTRLFVDEAQNFKNLSLGRAHYRVDGLGRKGSAACRHMHDAIRHVQHGGGGAVFLSGTIMTNSIADLYVLQTYLQPGTLELLGLRSFDAWANMFARKVTSFEIDVDTSSYRRTTRFGGFGNLGELASILANITDFHHLGAADGLPACDGRTDVLVRKSPSLTAYLKFISARAMQVRSGKVKSKDDNLLKICTDGHKAALDIHLVDGNAPLDSATSKVHACAVNVCRIWHDTIDRRLTQVVFCDMSTPKEGFNVYDELKGMLVGMGVPGQEVAFVHDARTERERTRLFEAVRTGGVRILVGSTFKLGIGVNIQDRLVAAHHLDVPWRPADMVQREGRILRQGNLNPRVEIFRYVTEGSFDAYSWQILENKQRVIDELLAGTYEGRFLESDVGDAALSYAEIKALAVNNPLLKERVEVANVLEHNLILQRRFHAMREEMQAEIQEKGEAIERLENESELCSRDLAHLSARGDIGMDPSTRMRTRVTVATAIQRYAFQPRDILLRGYYRGFSIVLPARTDPEDPHIWLIRNARHRVDLRDAKPVGIPIRMDNALAKIGERVAALDERIAELRRDRETLVAELASKGADRSRQIARCRARLARIDVELEKRDEQKRS